jgi:amidase
VRRSSGRFACDRQAAGLPVGVQIIGAEGEDPTTIEFARLLAAEIGGFAPPPDFT